MQVSVIMYMYEITSSSFIFLKKNQTSMANDVMTKPKKIDSDLICTVQYRDISNHTNS
jgi:hypothetical protein